MNAELKKWLNDNSENLCQRGSYGESGDSVSAVRLSSICDLFDGKVLVPVEPTDAMVDALYPGTGAHTCRDLYQAMLAASQEQVSATAREVGE